jgi:hypothetical protein
MRVASEVARPVLDWRQSALWVFAPTLKTLSVGTWSSLRSLLTMFCRSLIEADEFDKLQNIRRRQCNNF